MEDAEIIPDVGDVAGLTRLYWRAVARVRASDIPEADKQAWIAEIDRQPARPRHEDDRRVVARA